MSEYLAMGGYAAFIWPAYAIVAAVLIGLLVISLRSLRLREAEVARHDAGRGRGRREQRTHNDQAEPT